MRKVSKESRKNKLPPTPNFLVGLRITTTSTGKLVHANPGSHFFPANALILIPSGFQERSELVILQPIFIEPRLKIKPYEDREAPNL